MLESERRCTEFIHTWLAAAYVVLYFLEGLSAKELAMATQLIESLSDDFVPAQFRDEYREKVLDLIEQKAAGVETVVATPQPADEGRVVDLMAALEASVQAAREARQAPAKKKKDKSA